MSIANIATVVSVFLAGLVPASCQKTSPQTKAPAAIQTVVAATGTTNTILHDLGEVSLTNHYETCVKLGGGKDCILSPKMIDKGNVEITFALESKTKTGKIHDLSVAQVVTRSGKQVDIALGDFNLSLTPRMVTE